MNKEKYDIIAIDISKETLQNQTAEERFSVTYSKRGLGQIHKRIRKLKNPLVVCEATGGYESILMDFLHERNIAVCLVSPNRIRAFAKSEGIKAKSDPIDTDVIYRFALGKQLRMTPPPDPIRKEIAILMDRRSQLKELIASEKNRIQKCPKNMEKGIARMISFIDKELSEIEKMIRDLINSNDDLKQYSKAMQEVSGVGEATAWSILAYLTEIGDLNRAQITAIVGLAPFNRDSGKWKGKRCIQGGRAKVRKCLYMAAKTAAQHNDVIKPYTEGLIARGKSYKMAMVAAMRKILIYLQVIIKNLQTELAL